MSGDEQERAKEEVPTGQVYMGPGKPPQSVGDRPAGLIPLSPTQMKLQARKIELVRKLNAVNKAIEVLKTNPEAERILILMAEAGVL